MGLMFQVKSVKEEKAALDAASAASGLDQHLLNGEGGSEADEAISITGGGGADSAKTYALRKRQQQQQQGYDSESPEVVSSNIVPAGNETEGSWTDKLSPTTKRVLGISMSLMAGW